MAVKMQTFDSREAWLKQRGLRIGGSDAACLIGMNPWKNNVQLFREKMHTVVDEIDNDAMAYGREAEPVLRKLFALDHPELKVMYEENNLWTNDMYPFAHASLDGWISPDESGGGIIEIKTATIRSRIQAQEWDGRIPNNYY
jgi:putative phage-type endonuclease